jgi:hypothetical protein
MVEVGKILKDTDIFSAHFKAVNPDWTLFFDKLETPLPLRIVCSSSRLGFKQVRSSLEDAFQGKFMHQELRHHRLGG